ncbi:hypothetical protein [Rothia aeria]|uniref:hypothetical protein n=1 Tax=Rothia aeria TaxID=172042 RepID=UPI0028E59253|nr:hypothetical protein [Rothia aeria]
MPEKHNAERRERYTKAVEQLGSKEAPVRIGGVYTLVSLVDEWLREENIEYNERIAEGQVIINILCAYIRSPFTLAAHYDELIQDAPTAEGLYKNREQEFYIDKAGLESEKKVRLSIIQEIRHRLQGSKENTPGAWSDFEYDFSGSTFFYPVDFTHSYYAKPVNFSGSAYWGEADFRSSTYRGSAGFARSTYRGGAYFNGSTYLSEAVFRGSVYRCATTFNDSVYHYWVDLRGSTYQGAADFGGSIYRYWADFRGSTYRRWAYFNDSICCGWAGLSHSVYEGEADFSGSIFCSDIYFGQDGDNSSFSRFTGCAPQFYDETNHKNTLFGSHNNNFTVENGRGHPIYRGLEDLPLGCCFLAETQEEYLSGIFKEIEETREKLLTTEYFQEKIRLPGKLRAFNTALHEWREKVTTAQRTR